jgi:3-hydroxybutyrate dehydrogenase
MPIDLAGKAALVTGAASGIGRAIAEDLSAHGACVLLADLNADAGQALAASLPRALFQSADVRSREQCQALVQRAEREWGGVDVLVNNAGLQHVAPVEEFPEDRWDALLAILLTSPFLLAKYAWEALRAAPEGGRFIPIASAHALAASPYKAGYVSAKHGVLGLVKTLALEGATDGITAAAVCPGYVRTPLVEKQIADQAKAHGISEDRVIEEVILTPHARKALIEPSDVADVVAFLTTSAGRTFTGAPVTMDMGWTAR